MGGSDGSVLSLATCRAGQTYEARVSETVKRSAWSIRPFATTN